MGSRDKKAEEIIEETMKEFLSDLNQSKSFHETDGSNDISRKKSSGKKEKKKTQILLPEIKNLIGNFICRQGGKQKKWKK